jgi:hypothetical protein
MPLLPALRLHLDAMFTQPHTAYPAVWTPNVDSYFSPEHGSPDALLPTSVIPGGTLECGAHVQFAVPGIITAIRYYRPFNGGPVSRIVNLWTTAGVLLDTEPAVNISGGARWVEVPLTTPIVVAAGVVLVVSYGVTSVDYSRHDSVAMPVNNGGNVSLISACYNAQANMFPSVPSTSYFFADVVFRASNPGAAPVATNVLFLASTDEVFQGELARANTYVIIHQANAFVGMVAGDAIVVDGNNYLVLQTDLIDDGEACRSLLSKAN